MGSKKHKKESKKKKHRSRSRSPLDGGEERERKRHKKHKDRKRERSPDIEEVPVDSHLKPVEDQSQSRSGSSSAERESERERERRQRDLAQAAKRDDNASNERAGFTEAGSSGRAQESLSIDETNRLRAKLGLKPLQVAESAPAEDGKITDDLGEFYHKPAANIAEQKRAEKLREKLDERREKRKMENKLKTTLLTADVSDDEDAMAWVKKSRDLQKQKQEAAKRAAMLDEMDEVFGVSALVEEETQLQRGAQYGARDIGKLRVAHDYSVLEEEREIVLTLADKPVLGEDTEDVLVNVNIADDERARKNIEERKKAKTGYRAYDEEADFEALALGYQKPVLAKYDDEIDPEATHKKKGFRLGDTDAIEASRFRDMMRQEQLSGGPNKRLESLVLPPLRPANDFYTAQEMDTKFKKIKRKGKPRRRVKEELVEEQESAAALHTDDTEVKVTSLETDELETEPDVELQAAIARALRSQHRTQKMETVVKSEVQEQLPEELECEGGMVLDSTAEFCRQLGDIPTYGLAPNRHLQQPNTEDPEMPMEEEEPEQNDSGAWSRVDTSAEHPPHDLTTERAAGLEAEPALGGGVAGALRLALSKGYLQREQAARPAADHPLAALAYTIEDKAHIEDDKDRRRERSSHGAIHEFREKSNFRPSVKLEYVDDDGRPLCPKEAFRYLSHKFHGKGPGKNKHEKRIKKAVQEGLMKKMSSTDTPLNTLQLLQDKQRETGSAHVILSGQRKPN